MKFKQEFVLRTIAGDTVLIPVGNAGDPFHGIITLNETSKFIFEKLNDGLEPDEIAEAICSEYDVTIDKAHADIEKLLNKFKALGVL